MVREKDSDSDESDSTLSNRVSSGPPSGISNGKPKIGRGRGRGRLKTQSSSNSNLSGFSSTKKSGVSLASSNGSGSQSQSQSGTNDLSSLINGSNDSESKSAFSDLKSGKSSISNQLSIGMSRMSTNSGFSCANNGPQIRKVFIFLLLRPLDLAQCA